MAEVVYSSAKHESTAWDFEKVVFQMPLLSKAPSRYRQLNNPHVKVRYRLILPLSLLVLSGCLFDSDSDKIVGDYETGWIDIPQTRNISKGEQIVPEYVSEIGHSAKYIIAKQHPIKQGNIVKVLADTTNYYIIEVSSNSFQDKPVYGPLRQAAFDSLKQKLKISDIKFDMHYPEFQ